ncbi:Metallo-dependent phosphatase-like protein [Dactylonectria estremocensis]|uniref:Metallo-dependent phosphatase-like protein n=1 Tax=Dactylonectria estremocensis TaxID=1079267 RepID=A0A9P9FD37_9HYPO|nr:Metallo-dependent phosphatase-like protein [Dactylonectria estremocensis]
MSGVAPASTPKIKTRILIISDTHGLKPKPKLSTDASTEDELGQDDIVWMRTGFREPLAEADVVLHCGDLTKRSRVSEYRDTFAMLRSIRAPLKLVIAGNHDFALDEPYFYREWNGSKDTVDAVQDIINTAKADGVRYLTEGSHTFTLANGARLKIFASPYTPSYGGWAFQYDEGHDFNIPSDADIAMTHGPARGILDLAGTPGSYTKAGCPHLFESIYRAKPKIHCCGHIHEAWGGRLVRWREGDGGPTRVASVVCAEGSESMTMEDLMPDRFTQDEETVRTKLNSLIQMSQQRGVHVDLSEGPRRLTPGEQTLFLNASILNRRYQPVHLPFLVDVELDRAEVTSLVQMPEQN